MSAPLFGPYILDEGPYEPWSHQFLDALSWQCHRVIAERIRRDPSLLRIPRENIRRWIARDIYHEGEKRSLLEWEPLLDEARLDGLIAAMIDPGERGQRMRQSAPFVGILPQAERREIRQRMIAKWDAHEAAAA